jgi:hypothetical protein
MSAAPLPRGLRPRGAANFESGLEHRFIKASPPKSQGTPDLADFRLQRAVAKLHRLGPRPLYELLVELGARFLLRTEIETLVAEYIALDPAAVEAVGADHFAPPPTRQIWGRP